MKIPLHEYNKTYYKSISIHSRLDAVCSENQRNFGMDILKTAVTGSAGSGKSIVRKKLVRLGMAGFDCDRIAREIVEPGMPAFLRITRLLGEESVARDGTLDRQRVRQMIMENGDLRKQVEGVLHPLILETLFSKIETAESRGYQAAVAEVPLLFELCLENRFDLTIAVVSETETLVQRIMKRDGADRKSAEKILALQLGQQDKKRRADFVIENNARVQELNNEVERIFRKIEKERLTSA